MHKMYNFIHLVSALIRQFLLPNPYINLFENEIQADLFNVFVGGIILWKLSYWLTGAGYRKGIDNPASGSLGYLISYCYLTFLITLIGWLINNIRVFIIIFVIIYILSLIIVSKVFGKKYSF